jgi:MHS family proline/betaine transporter-like MFS transporter
MTVAAEPHSSRTKALTAAVIGNLVEWYEFTVYGFVAAVIGQLFFPSSDATTPLISSYAVFGLAFVVRPLDGLVFASIGDQFGRRNALAALLTLVSIATGAIGILPTYAAIGIAAPILLVACRMFQGFAFGGELAGTSTFILEYAPAGKRGLYTSMIGFTGGGGLILGALIVLLLQSTLSPDQFRSWGWRIPFVVGFIISFLGIYMRLRLEDTPVFRTIQQTNRVSHAPLLECVKTYWPTLILMFVFTSPQSLYFYLSAAFLLGYLIRDVGMAPPAALRLTLVLYAIAIVVCVTVGALMDKIGRRIPGLGKLTLISFGSLPAFYLLNGGSLVSVIGGILILGVTFGLALGVGGIIFSEIFPARIRYAGSAISSNAPQMIFGGTAPLISTWLVAATGNKLAPAVYVTAVGLISLAYCYFFLPETANYPVLRDEDQAAVSPSREVHTDVVVASRTS